MPCVFCEYKRSIIEQIDRSNRRPKRKKSQAVECIDVLVYRWRELHIVKCSFVLNFEHEIWRSNIPLSMKGGFSWEQQNAVFLCFSYVWHIDGKGGAWILFLTNGK